MLRSFALNTRSHIARLGLGLALTGALAVAALAPQPADAALKGNVHSPPTGGIYQPYPDLVVSQYVVGGRVTVSNQGDYEARPSVLAVSGVGNWAIPALASGASYTVPMPIMRCSEGAWTARADSSNVVNESVESNNARTVRIIC